MSDPSTKDAHTFLYASLISFVFILASFLVFVVLGWKYELEILFTIATRGWFTVLAIFEKAFPAWLAFGLLGAILPRPRPAFLLALPISMGLVWQISKLRFGEDRLFELTLAATPYVYAVSIVFVSIGGMMRIAWRNRSGKSPP